MQPFNQTGTKWMMKGFMRDKIKRLFSFGCPSLDTFEKNAQRAKELGATHILITENLPPSMWQYEESGDPYTAWFVNNPGLLKIFPPKMIKPFVNVQYSDKVVGILKERCDVLRKLDLKAHWFTNEPQVLPEGFFAKYPHLRGPRVDQSNRARTAHFAPCADQPKVLEMYKESVQMLLKKCPEIEIFYFLTTDSGSGFCWAPALYPGKNGNTHCKSRPMEDRIAGFMLNMRTAAEEIGRYIEIDIVEVAPRSWMLPTFDSPMAIVKKLTEGLAVNHLEGPDGKRFISRDREPVWWNVFYPVVGIARPFDFIRKCVEEKRNETKRHVHTINDIENTDLCFSFLEAYFKKQPQTDYEIITLLRQVARGIGGDEQADKILSLWMAIDDIEKYLGTIDFGPLFVNTCLLTRWLTRPLIPFPEELPAEQKQYYRKYILQAKDDEQADNLLDIQAMDMFKGWGAMLIVQNVLEIVEAKIKSAQSVICELAKNSDSNSKPWRLLNKRLGVLTCLVKNVYNVVRYQAHLDRIKPVTQETPVDQNPPLGAQGSWDYADMTNTARAEIDNVLHLKSLLESTDQRLIDFAEKAEDENVLRFGPELKSQLKLKVDIMNHHWQDYKRLFVTPNP
jgi:hypothetical protein